MRSDWEFWGLPGTSEFDPAQEDYDRWRVSLRKTWWLEKFRNFGLELTHVGGSDLDRFSRYDFGIFGDLSIPGYQGGLVRADEASGVEMSYGVSIGDVIRFEVDGASAWVTNDDTGLDNEMLAGVGLEGSMPLPWQLLTNFELGVGVVGPGRGRSRRAHRVPQAVRRRGEQARRRRSRRTDRERRAAMISASRDGSSPPA